MNLLSSREKKTVKDLAKKTRYWRKIHYYLGLSVAIFLLLSAATGILLGWKKHSDTIQPSTQKSNMITPDTWLSISQVNAIALGAAEDGKKVDRIDVRPEKGIAKVLLKPGYTEVQIDLNSGEILSHETRYSDLIEQIHDGSIFGDGFRLLSMNTLGTAVLISIFSGLWLWYGPRRIRRSKHPR